MTANQRRVLDHMDANNIGAIPIGGEYRFKQAFRESEELADKMCDLLDARAKEIRYESEIERIASIGNDFDWNNA